MKLIILMVLCLCLTGCVGETRAERTARLAEEQRLSVENQQALTAQAQAQAAIVQAEQNAIMYQTLADAAKPNYTPLLVVAVLAVVAILLIVRWHMIALTHVAAGQAVRGDDMRLLPGAPGFYPALRQIAKREGGRVEVQGDSYYLVMNDERVKVKSLPGGEL